MSKIRDTEFAYSVAKVRAVENRLLDRVKLARLSEADGVIEAVKILKESGYEGETAEQMLSFEREKTYAFLRDISPSKEAFDIFLVKNDYHNIKVLLKAEFLGENFDFLLTDSGRYPAQKLKNMVSNRSLGGLPQIMQQAINKAIDLLEKTGDPQLSELALDRAAQAEMHSLAKETESEYIADIVSVMTDLKNILNYIRVQRMQKGADFLLKTLSDGGKIKPEAFVRDMGEPLSEILSGTVYDGLSEFEKDISELEKQTDNFLIRYIKKAKYITFGIEPLVAYLIAKENEIKQAQIILTGKKNNISADIIKERLRESYV